MAFFAFLGVYRLAWLRGWLRPEIPPPRPVHQSVSTGFLSAFLCHCVSEPCTGSRQSFSPSSANQTGIEIVLPDFLPITLSLM